LAKTAIVQIKNSINNKQHKMAAIATFAGVATIQDIIHMRESNDEARIFYDAFFYDVLRDRATGLACHYAAVMRAGCNALRIRGVHDRLLMMRSLVRMCEATSQESYKKQCSQARERHLVMSEFMSEQLNSLMECGTSEDVRIYADGMKYTYESIEKMLKVTEKIAGSRWV
jgi:hypothetical protein